MDGCELARQVRSNKSLRGCFIVAISGYGNEDQRRRCREAGVDLFLAKPVNLEVLESLLKLEGDRCGLLQKTGDGNSPKVLTCQPSHRGFLIHLP
jgi:CheY-like chemotaxis protein